MTLPIFQLVQVIKDTIVHRGAKGCIYRLLLEDVGATPPLGYFIAQRYIAGCGFHFRIGEKYLDICGQSFDNFVAYYHEIVCYACETEIDHLCGIVDPGVILEEEKHLQLALETVAASETIGCLISEITRSDGASQTHASVDKLVGLGYLVKQSINPVAKSTKCRTESKSVVLHNKLYASDYDEAADGVKIIVGNNYLDKVHDLIIEVLEKRNVRSLSARELSKCLGISRWDMQALRNATIALDRKDGARVCFFQATCHVTYDSGVLGPETRMWCVGRAADRAELDAAGSGQRPFLCSRNVPVHQAIVTVLNNGGQYRAGVTSSDIRSITGASYKRAAKLFTEFHKSFGYPLEKVQEGKQLKYRVLPKQRSESSPPSVAAIKAEGGGEVAEAEEESMHIQQPAELPSSSAATLLFSDQQRLNCDTIENFLRERGGVASFEEIVSTVRTESRRRQRAQAREQAQSGGEMQAAAEVGAVHSTTMDRRTITRTVGLLEHTLQRVFSRSVSLAAPEASASSGSRALPAGVTDGASLTLVLLSECAWNEETLIAEYVARLGAPSDSGEGESDTGSLLGAATPLKARAGRKKKAKRRVQEPSSDSDSSCSDPHSRGSSRGRSDSEASASRSAGTRTVARRRSKPAAARGLVKDIQGTDTADQHLGEGSRDATAACTGEEASRRKARMISLKQRKRNDDPALLDWRLAAQGQESPCTALVQVAGALVGALCLHHSLVELAPALEEECAQKSVDGPESVNAHGGLTHDSAPIVLRDVARFLPFEHLFKTSEALRLALENESAGDAVDAPLQSEIAVALMERSSTHSALQGSDGLEESGARSSALAGVLRAFLSGSCRKELSSQMCLLAALGIVRFRDSSLSAALAAALRGDGEEISAAVSDIIAMLRSEEAVGDPIQASAVCDAVQLGALAQLYSLLQLGGEAARRAEDFFFEQAFCLRLVPVGSWQPVQSALEVYHHWRTVVLPSLSVDWRGLRYDRPLPNLAMHLLHYWEEERPGDLPSGTPRAQNRMLFTGGKVNMDHWGSSLVRSAWAACAPLPWTVLLAPASLEAARAVAESASGATGELATATDFSLDMPRRASTGRGRRGKRSSGDSAFLHTVATAGEPSPASKRQRVVSKSGAGETVAEGTDDDFLDVQGNGWSRISDAQLQEELQSLQEQGGDGLDWSTSQIALMVEVLLVRYFVREQRVEQVPRVLRADASGSSKLCGVGPLESFLDIDWNETDFSLVSEASLAMVLSTCGLPDQKVAKQRVAQCIRHRPSMRDMVAWVLCNKGRRVSNTFASMLNEMSTGAFNGKQASCSSGSGGSGGESGSRTERHAVWNLLMQSYAESEERRDFDKQQLEALRSFPLGSVAQTTLEMFVRGLLRHCPDCGSASCRAKNASCPHTKRAFELTERFAELQRGAHAASFYSSWWERWAQGQEGGQQPGTAVHPARLLPNLPCCDTSLSSCRILSVVQLLSSRPGWLDTALVLRHDLHQQQEAEGELRHSEPCSSKGASGGIAIFDASACEAHSGFCEKGLNDIGVDMCAAVDTLTAPHSAFNWTRAAETADGIPTAQGVSVPWEECHGVSVTRNAPLLRLFAARVLAVLAQKPGSRLSGLHVALEVLSFAQVRRLLHEMVALGWVVQRRPVVSARLCGPFAPAVGSSERIAEAESVYFVGQF